MPARNDFSKIGLSWDAEAVQPSLDNCSRWKDRKVQVWFAAVSGKQYAGELLKIHFF
jgi:hypothetical protein